MSTNPDHLSRRQILRATAFGLAGASLAPIPVFPAEDTFRDDVAINESTALIFPEQAPLRPQGDLKDARAVWCHTPKEPARSVLLYFHGHNGYVTVDAKGRSRVPDWAASDALARAGASGKDAAPLVYGLDTLSPRLKNEPMVLAPEVSTLATGSFWAKEPSGQYDDPARLKLLVEDCRRHLARLPRPDGSHFLPPDFEKEAIERVYLCGHSGAGIPLEEAAGSAMILPGGGVPTDLWLFDCTYWSKVERFVKFCERWHAVDRLAGGRPDASRFVCVYRPKTQTEEVADELRTAIAKSLGVDAGTLVMNHSDEDHAAAIQPAFKKSGVVFVRTKLSHDEIPKFFIPGLIETAGS
ncbi:hypothetical protein [Paludisphaera rhizosphaerae]|uniref:hypothetical protein n=1 Tax=Paludisphaera rhizosphaerae TaxID=2711216 RepID=UPI0013EAA363|nr:hypothetical protein [Paludisphaera rhizosphaerae]